MCIFLLFILRTNLHHNYSYWLGKIGNSNSNHWSLKVNSFAIMFWWLLQPYSHFEHILILTMTPDHRQYYKISIRYHSSLGVCFTCSLLFLNLPDFALQFFLFLLSFLLRLWMMKYELTAIIIKLYSIFLNPKYYFYISIIFLYPWWIKYRQNCPFCLTDKILKFGIKNNENYMVAELNYIAAIFP